MKYFKIITKHIKDKRGFSLVEMVMALIIVSVMAGVVSVEHMKSVRDSRRTSFVEELKTVKGAVMSFYNKNGYWPASSTFTGNTSNITSKLGAWFDGNMDDRWATRCSATEGFTIEAHNIGADLQPLLQTDFAKICSSVSITGPNNASQNKTVDCTILAVADISNAATQCQ